jgi:hypothetical protein
MAGSMLGTTSLATYTVEAQRSRGRSCGDGVRPIVWTYDRLSMTMDVAFEKAVRMNTHFPFALVQYDGMLFAVDERCELATAERHERIAAYGL